MTVNQRYNDPLWERIRQEVEDELKNEPVLASYLYSTILNHRSLEDSVSFILSTKLSGNVVDAMGFREIINEAYASDYQLGEKMRADIAAVFGRDPACHYRFIPLLYFKGFHALQSYRISHFLWQNKRETLALYLQSRISEVFGVDIHPAARIGSGVLIDHATSVIIGETAVVEDNVSILHEVTLGGTGNEEGDRHPKVRAGVLIGAGAKILGNVEVGEGAKVGACSVVLGDVPAHCTVAGVPAKVVGKPFSHEPAMDMDHHLSYKVKRHIPCEKNEICDKKDCDECSL